MCVYVCTWVRACAYVHDTINMELTIFILCMGTLKKILPRARAVLIALLIFSLHSSTATGSRPVTTVASTVTNVGSALLSSSNDNKLMFTTAELFRLDNKPYQRLLLYITYLLLNPVMGRMASLSLLDNIDEYHTKPV